MTGEEGLDGNRPVVEDGVDRLERAEEASLCRPEAYQQRLREFLLDAGFHDVLADVADATEFDSGLVEMIQDADELLVRDLMRVRHDGEGEDALDSEVGTAVRLSFYTSAHTVGLNARGLRSLGGASSYQNLQAFG